MAIIIPANTLASGGYAVDNSCRFDGSSAYMHKTPGGAGNLRTFTISFWVKRSSLGQMWMFQQGADNGTDTTYLRFTPTHQLSFADYSAGGEFELATNRLFRDFSAWYHIVVAVDTTQGTAANRVKIYVNGVQETSFATETYPSENYDTELNGTDLLTLCRRVDDGGSPQLYYNGYLAETVMVDGTALAPTSFGEFDEDSGIWKPIDVSGLTFGTNGFYLDFENSGALGADVSGNTNNFTVNNLTAIDQTTDTPTNNFATLNPLDVSSGTAATVSDGNLTLRHGGGANGSHTMLRSTLAINSGKWYCEYKQTENGGTNRFGIIDIAQSDYPTGTNPYVGAFSKGYAYLSDGQKENNSTQASYGDSYTSGDIIGVAFDADNGTIWFSKNGTWQISATQSEIEAGTTTNSAYSSLDTSLYYAFASSPYNNQTGSHNFGSPPYAISSGNADGDGYGNFEYSVPSGYYALCTKNLAEYG